MQRIERYGVIALVFLLVTIVAVSLWGEQRKAGGGLFQFLKRESKSAQVDRLVAEVGPTSAPAGRAVSTTDVFGRSLPLSPEPEPLQVPPALSGPPLPFPSSLEQALADPVLDGPVILPEAVPSTRDLPRPAPPVEPEPTPRPAGPTSYTVRAGDTLSEIALRELGTSRRWREIVALNDGLDPQKLVVGKTIQLPAQDGSASPPAERQEQPRIATPQPEVSPPTGGRTYRVRAGDTLSEIALRELGTSQRWREIVALNDGLDPRKLVVGKALRLPADALVAAGPRLAAADRPDSTPRRSKVR